MKHTFGPIALGAVMILITGCGGSQPTTSSASAAVAPSSAPAVAASDAPSSAAATVSPETTASPSAAANQPSLPAIFSSHGNPGLEALLPANVSGTPMGRYSLSLSDLLDAGGDRASIDAFLTGVGKTEADGSFAVAVDPTNSLGGGIFAFKVSGVDTASLLAGIVAAEQADLDGATPSPATVGGKNVTVLSRGSGPNDTEWLYGRDDVVFVVHAADEAGATAYLQALP